MTGAANRGTSDTMKNCLPLILLAAAISALAQDKPPEAPKGEPADARFKDVPKEHVAAIVALDAENPKWLASWLTIREMQDEMRRLAGVFGVEKRKRAERELRSLESQLPREMEAFGRMQQRSREPLIQKEAALKDQAFRMSQKEPTGSDVKRQAAEKKLAGLYEEIGALGDKIRALDSLEALVGQHRLPDRLEQVGISDRDTAVRGQADNMAGLVERLLEVKDCLADIRDIQTREDAPERTAADKRALGAAEAGLEKAAADLRKEAARLQKPIEMELERTEKQVESLKRRIDAQAKRKRPTEELDLQLGEIEVKAAEWKALIETIAGLADWEKLKPAAAKPKPAADR